MRGGAARAPEGPQKRRYGVTLCKTSCAVELANKDFATVINELPEGTFQRFPLCSVHGVPLMKPIADRWEDVENVQARPDDILIVSYPKAGTTWMQEIVDAIMNDGEVEKTKRAPTHVRSPFLEMFAPPPLPSGIDVLNMTPSPRQIKTHLQFKLVPQSFREQNCKTVYIARNAKDTVVSYYFFDQMNKTQPDPGTWDQYVEKFLKGEVAWGSWFDHVIGWWNAKDKHDILYVFYEDIKEDPKRELRKLMEFLGKNLSEEALDKVCHHIAFKAMKENPMANYSTVPDVILDQSHSPFMRKGEVGDWKNHFTVLQNEMFDKEYEERMKGMDVKFRTTI